MTPLLLKELKKHFEPKFEAYIVPREELVSNDFPQIYLIHPHADFIAISEWSRAPLYLAIDGKAIYYGTETHKFDISNPEFDPEQFCESFVNLHSFFIRSILMRGSRK